MPWAIYHHFKQNVAELGAFQCKSSQPNDRNIAQNQWKMKKKDKNGVYYISKKEGKYVMWVVKLNLKNSVSGFLGHI